MATATIYAHSADANLESGSVFPESSWSAARAGTGSGGITKRDQARYFACHVDYNVGTALAYGVSRSFLCFDLASNVPAGATITAVDLYVYVYGASSADGGSVQLVASTQASPTALATSDWSAVGSTDLATAKTFASLTTGAYNTFSLNAAGITAANAAISSYLKLAFRASKDVSNTAPTDRSYMSISYSDQTGSGEDPYIVVTYTPPPGAGAMRRRPSGLIAPARFVR